MPTKCNQVMDYIVYVYGVYHGRALNEGLMEHLTNDLDLEVKPHRRAIRSTLQISFVFVFWLRKR